MSSTPPSAGGGAPSTSPTPAGESQVRRILLLVVSFVRVRWRSILEIAIPVLIYIILFKLNLIPAVTRTLVGAPGAPITIYADSAAMSGEKAGDPGRRPYIPPESPRVLKPREDGGLELKYNVAGFTLVPKLGVHFDLGGGDLHWMAGARILYVDAFGLGPAFNDRTVGLVLDRRFKVDLMQNLTADIGLGVPWGTLNGSVAPSLRFSFGLSLTTGILQ